MNVFYLYSKILTSGVTHWNLNLLLVSYLFTFLFFIGITERKEGRKERRRRERKKKKERKEGRKEGRKTSSLRLNQFLRILVLTSQLDDILLF